MIGLQESILKIPDVIVISISNKKFLKNKIVSARNFSTNKSKRFEGRRGDIARMASNFAGVQGSNVSRNDLVIRGNIPLGIL